MASSDVDFQRSYRISGDRKYSVESPPYKVFSRGRQDSNLSSAPSVPSTYFRATYSSSSAYPTSASIPDESESPTPRESFDSIVDDPFFQRYHAADTASDVKQASGSQSASQRHDNPPTKPHPVPRRESLTIHESDARPQLLPTMERINITVIGANGVGKSHFIQRSLGLARAPGAQPTAQRISIDGSTYAVTLFELDLEYFDVDPDRQIQWPRQIGGALMPQVHGVLLLYDVTNRDSIIELPQTLTALVKSSLPTVLVATKCDNPENTRQIDTEGVAEACKSCIASYKTSSSKPESTKLPLSTLLRALVAGNQDESLEGAGLRRRAASEAHLIAPMDPSVGRPSTPQSKHSRASSDMSLLQGIASQSGGHNYHDSIGDGQTVSSMLRSSGIRIDRQGSTASFLDIEESDGDSLGYSDEISILQRGDDLFERPTKKSGISFDDLVERLIAHKLSKVDSNFSDIFLCLYRKFAAPGELFSAIRSRMDQVQSDKSIHYLSKASTQLRIIEAIAKWVASYPGDFARPATRKKLEDFIRDLSTEPIFTAAAQQMRRNLEYSVVEDDDTGWAKADDEENGSEAASSVSKVSGDLNESMTSLSVDDPANRRPSASSSVYAESHVSSKVHQFQFHSYEDYEREAATMVPSYTLPLTKFRYHIFMDTSDDDIADEMTRIDWVMLSSIRIRDLVRHVGLNQEQKEKSKSAKNVNRMIAHFNHIAKWVANMILMRDKAKHRAQMLEKFMNIALKLRQLNNYNGLAAVLAGINGTAIHRLSQTRSLVPTDVQKRFARLLLLMGTQKSHFAYRLAWENSPLPRIPYMPLHRRDLVSAEQGSMTFVGPQGDRINWKKFEVLGEVILPIMRSQSTPYPNLTKHETARELILDCLMPTDDEDIYQRSVAVESSSGSALDSSKKKFPWFAAK